MKTSTKERKDKPIRKIRAGTVAGYIVLVLLVALVVYVIIPTQPATPTKSPKRAAMVDPLSVHSPNEVFMDATIELVQ